MTDPVQAILMLAGICFAAMAIGGSFVFGVATVCRWMAWAPVNTSIDVHYHEAARSVASDHRGTE
jgi:hypothetical protein